MRTTMGCKRAVASALVAIALTGCAGDPAAPALRVPEPAGLSLAVLPESVTNRYIVVFRPSVARPAEEAQQLVDRLGGLPFRLYQTALKGFAVANLSPSALAALRAHPAVAYVEEDGLNYPNDVQFLPLDNFSYQYSSGWGLDRMDERAAMFNGQRQFFARGTGVHVYIIDSGIRGDHEQFAGRLGDGITFTSGYGIPGGNPYDDQLPHGTLAASVAAGTTYGAAPGATIHSIRIDDEHEGAYSSDIVAGLDAVAQIAVKPAVANLSYGGIPSAFSIRDAIEGVVRSGVAFTKAAGNDSTDALEDRGNRAAGAIIVGASDRFDTPASFGNTGSLLALFAPGVSVRVATNSSSTGTALASGTSLAAPYVAGVAAAVLEREPAATPYRVKEVLVSSATENVLANVGTSSPNLLLYSLFTGVVIDGPSAIVTEAAQSATWTAVTSGGVGGFTYQWEAAVNTGAYSVVSTASTYTRAFSVNQAFTLKLRLTVVSGGDTRVTAKNVSVVRPPSSCPPPQKAC